MDSGAGLRNETALPLSRVRDRVDQPLAVVAFLGDRLALAEGGVGAERSVAARGDQDLVARA